MIFYQVRKLPAHRSMREISELIWQTCKTYLLQQGKFLILLWVFIAIVIGVYFGLSSDFTGTKVLIILLFSIVGILGSYGVAWFGIRVNTYANSRTAFESLRGKPYGIHAIPMRSGMSVGMMLISVELIIMLIILLWIPRDYAGACFIGFAIGESLGAAALRIAGGIFTKIADIGSDLMKIVFNIKEDDARNPGVIADCTGDNAGDSVGPSADGFETYGVTGVALITFIILAVSDPLIQVSLLVWIFAMRVMMIVSSGGSYFLNAAITKARYKNADKMNFEAPADLPGLADLDHLHHPDLRRVLLPDRRQHRHRPGAPGLLVAAFHHHQHGHAGRRPDPRAGQSVHLHQVGACEGSGRLDQGRAGPRSTSSPALWPVTTAPTTSASPSWCSWASATSSARRASARRGASCWRRPCSPSVSWPSASWAWAR